MSNSWIIPFVAAVAIVAAVSSQNAIAQDQPEAETPPTVPPPVIEKVRIHDEVFKLELAADTPAHGKGLGGRTEIATDGGMLFAFPTERSRGFWMADCTIDIDIIFLDRNGRIMATHEMKKEAPRRDDETMAQYWRRLKNYSSGRPAQFVIELKDGWLKKLRLKRGEMIEFDVKRLAALARKNLQDQQRNDP